MTLSYQERRKKRHERIRKVIRGTTERPRLSVFKSSKHLYGQVVNDYERKNLVTFSTAGEKFRKAFPKGSNAEAARKLGELFGPQLVQKGIKKVVFDRGGYKYHGRIKALAEALREAGLEF